jgi:cytochrome b
MSLTAQKTWVQVWDPLVRWGHWVLAVAFATAFLSGEDESGGPDQLHIWAGYAVGIIVAARVLWGLVGTKHARFSDFTYTPATALTYLTDMLRGTGRRYVGHSPAAFYMIVALLASLAGTVWTGYVAYGGGQAAPTLTASPRIAAAHGQEQEGREEGEGQRGEGGATDVADLHAALANITLGLVIVHLLGVGLASIVHRENLVSAMFSGRKRAEDNG